MTVTPGTDGVLEIEEEAELGALVCAEVRELLAVEERFSARDLVGGCPISA